MKDEMYIKSMMDKIDETTMDHMLDAVDDVLEDMHKLQGSINRLTAARTWGSKRLTDNWHLNEDEDAVRHAYRDLDEVVDLLAHHIQEANAEIFDDTDEDEEADVDDGE